MIAIMVLRGNEEGSEVAEKKIGELFHREVTLRVIVECKGK